MVIIDYLQLLDTTTRNANTPPARREIRRRRRRTYDELASDETERRSSFTGLRSCFVVVRCSDDRKG